MRKYFFYLLVGCTAINATGTLFGFFGSLAWWLDLFAHFHLHMMLAGVLGVCATWLVRQKRALFAVNLIVILINAIVVLPYFLASSKSVERANVKLVAWNILYTNNEVDLGIKYLQQANTDIVVIAEPTEIWREGMGSLQDIYPYQFHNPECDDVGCAISLLSKHPWKSVQTKKLVSDTPPVIWAQFDSVNGSGPFAVVAVHMRKATDDDGAMRQNRQAKELGKITAAFDVPFLLVGDMNATPMSAAFNTILSETGTEQTYKAWFATWPTVLGKLGIPIDHVLTKGKISVQVELGPSGGSDHFPLGIMVAIP